MNKILILVEKEYISFSKYNRSISEENLSETVTEEAWDKDGLIRVTRRLEEEEVTLLFHAGEGAVFLPELSGKQDLLTGNVFDGMVQGITALVLQ